MNVLVIGCGLLGRKIARTMDEMGWDVSVLSNIESDLELLENDFEGVTFRGFPMDIRNLREAGIESCDAVAVTTADDNLNITVAQIARDYFGIQNVVARVSDPARELIFEHMGLHTICPTNHAGDRIVRMLSGEKLNKKLEFGLHTAGGAASDRQECGRTARQPGRSGVRHHPQKRRVRFSGACALEARGR